MRIIDNNYNKQRLIKYIQPTNTLCGQMADLLDIVLNSSFLNQGNIYLFIYLFIVLPRNPYTGVIQWI